MSNSFSDGFDQRAVVLIAKLIQPVPPPLGAPWVGYDCTPAARRPAEPSWLLFAPSLLVPWLFSPSLFEAARPQLNMSANPVAAPRRLVIVAVAEPLSVRSPALSRTLVLETAFGTR